MMQKVCMQQFPPHMNRGLNFRLVRFYNFAVLFKVKMTLPQRKKVGHSS